MQKSRKLCRVARSIALLVSFTGVVHAQQQEADSLQTVQSPEVIVTALRQPTAAGDVPYALSTATVREGAPGISLSEILSSVPGVQVRNRFNNAVGERITIRGFGSRTQFGVRGVRVVIDEMPATFADGQSALEGIETSTVARAEVVRGPASALYGNASGGVILLRSTPPSALPVEFDLGMTATTNDLIRVGGGASGTIGPAAYSVGYSNLLDSGSRMHSVSHAQRAAAQAVYTLDEQSNLRLGAGWTTFDAENPGSLTRALSDADPTQAFANNVRQKTGKDGTQFQTSAGWSRQGNDGGASANAHLILRTITNPIPDRIIELDRTAAGARAGFNGTIDPAGMALGWNAGVDVDIQIDSRQNYGNKEGAREELMVDQDETVSAVGPWLQLRVPLGSDLVTMGSLRYDRVGFSVVDRFIDTADPDDSGSRTMDAFSPSAGIVWKPAERTSIYANVATAFETPTTTELANRPEGAGGFNPDLQPQRTLSFEVGAGGSLPFGLRYQLALYNATVTDALIPFQVENVPGRDFYRNAGSAIHRGLELALSAAPIRNTILSVSYSLTDARFGPDEVSSGVALEGKYLPGVARDNLNAEILWLPLDLLHLRLQGLASGREYGDDANTETIPGHFLMNLSLTSAELFTFTTKAQSRYSLGISLGVDNLLDAPYTASTTVNAFGKRYYEPGPGRTFYFKLTTGYADLGQGVE